MCLPNARSVDGHALPIDQLKGTKPVESIDLSGKKLGVASNFIIGACIKENAVLKELKCAAPFPCSAALTAFNTGCGLPWQPGGQCTLRD